MSRIHNVNGFSLLEGMIAAAIVGTGLLALLGMQASSLTHNVDAKDLTTATNLAADMVERIAFNRKNAAIYHGIDTMNGSTQPPTSQVMARGDYTQWSALLAGSGLSNAGGVVQVQLQDLNPATNTTSLGRRLVTVSVSWSAKREGTSSRRARTVSLATVVAPE